MADYLVTDTELTSIANAIRTRGGTSASLTFPAGFVSAIGDIPSGGTPKRGVIRPDAELVKTWSADFMAVEDKDITIPAYTTSATSLLASEPLGTYDGIPTTYRYFIVERTLTIPVYSITTLAKGREDYAYSSAGYEWVYHPANEIASLDKTKTYQQYSQMVAYAAASRYIYWSSGTAIAPYTSVSYGFNQTIVAPAIASNKTITIKSPSIAIRGHATYLAQTFFDAMTDVRCQYVIELWRVPVADDPVGGWVHRSNFASVINDVRNNNGKLT